MKSLTAMPPQRKNDFVRACLLKAKAGAQHQQIDDFLPPEDVVIRAIISRAAILPGSTTGAGNAAELVQTAFPGFLASLSPYSAAARIIAGALSVNLVKFDGAKYPVRSTPPAGAQWVAENGAIPISVADFSLIDVGPKRKIASIIPWTNELSKRSDADTVFEQLLREDVAASLDAAMLSTAAGSGSAHAGLLNGVSPIPGYGGSDLTSIEEDLIALGIAVSTNGGSGQVLFIMAPDRAIRLKIKAPILASSLDIATSAALPANRIVAVDAAAIISAVDNVPDLEFADQATLHMDTEPLPMSDGGGVAAPVISLWQTASKALRIIMDVAWAKRRSTAVAYVEDVSW